MIKHWIQGTAAALLALCLTPLHAQDSGLKGFLHRASSAITHTASKVLRGPANGASANAAGPATTDGAYYRPVSPSKSGDIVGIFAHHKVGDAWPRVAIKFTEAGTNLACWTATARVWRSATRHHDETFQVCNAPLAFTDAMGQTRYMTAPEDSIGNGQGRLQLLTAQNIQGISHVDTAVGGVRNMGPNPPHMLFDLGDATESGPFAHQYHEILIRLMWITSWMSHADPVLDNNSGKTLWIVGVDPAGNHNLRR
ncbi:hypothetical protein LQ772_11975 [Frateuria edaphi]|uniref:hypothetical protein n=1 Tax=Frateuria edaphi TaxID=2898793 RepID=UPI001E2D8630|nr:hypothetical protein [Frateuria edaphi]UGB44705.1 hypothetical protein LQ772_11975 [Frateuria edaphi]